MAGDMMLDFTMLIRAVNDGGASVVGRPKVLDRPTLPWESAKWILPCVVRIANGEGTFYATDLGPLEFVRRTGWRIVDAFGDHLVQAESPVGGCVVVGVNPGGGGVRSVAYASVEGRDR